MSASGAFGPLLKSYFKCAALHCLQALAAEGQDLTPVVAQLAHPRHPRAHAGLRWGLSPIHTRGPVQLSFLHYSGLRCQPVR